MSTMNFDMWIIGRKISLYEILNNLNFSIHIDWIMHGEFWAVREPVHGLTMEDLEQKLRTEPHGYALSSGELEEFAKPVQDLNDITLIGFHGEKNVVAIEGFDSSTWQVTVDDALVDSSQLAIFVNSLS